MINALVRQVNTREIESLKEENTILRVLIKDYVKKSMEYKELLQESLNLLDKYQEKTEKISMRTNIWTDEAVRLYKEHGDLGKALRALDKEIMLYELNKNKEES